MDHGKECSSLTTRVKSSLASQSPTDAIPYCILGVKQSSQEQVHALQRNLVAIPEGLSFCLSRDDNASKDHNLKAFSLIMMR